MELIKLFGDERMPEVAQPRRMSRSYDYSCEHCGSGIYEDDEYRGSNDDIFCSQSCIIEAGEE